MQNNGRPIEVIASVVRPERTKRPDLSGWGTRHEHYATLRASSGGVVEVSIHQYFPTLSASPAIIAGQVDVLPSRGRQVSPEIVGSVLNVTRSRAPQRNCPEIGGIMPLSQVPGLGWSAVEIGGRPRTEPVAAATGKGTISIFFACRVEQSGLAGVPRACPTFPLGRLKWQSSAT